MTNISRLPDPANDDFSAIIQSFLKNFHRSNEALVKPRRHSLKAFDFGFNHEARARQVVHHSSQAQNPPLGKREPLTRMTFHPIHAR